jgi:O-antigen/teichoic acid export membrane protein
MSSAIEPSRTRRPLQGIARNITSNWATLVVNTLISFIIAPIVVNSLGSVYYGLWTMLLQFTAYLWLFDFGVRESVVKYVAQYHASGDDHELETTIRTAFSLYGFVATAGVIGALGLAFSLPYFFNIPPDAVWTARATAFLTGATVAQSFLSNVFVGVLMGLQRFYQVSRIGIFFSVARAISIYVLMANGFGIISLALLQLVLSLVSAVICYVLCRMHLPQITFRPMGLASANVRKLLHYGKWVLVSNLGDKVIFSSDAIVIGLLMPISTLAYYAIGGSLIGHLRSFIQAMAAIFNPLSSSLHATQDSERLKRVVQGGARFAVLVGLAPCVGFIVLGERFITLWMGAEFGPTAGRVLAVLAAGYIVGLPYFTISGVLYGLGRHHIVALSRIVEGSVNLGLSVLLVKRYGWIGAAIGTAVPHAIMVAGVLPFILPEMVRPNLREYFVWTYVRPLVASVPFWLACFGVERVLAPTTIATFMGYGALTLLAYLPACWLIALSADERIDIGRALRRRVPFLRARTA